MKKRLGWSAGAAVVLVLTYGLFSGTDWRAVWGAVRTVRLDWLLAAEGLLFAAHLARVERWRAIIHQTAEVPYRTVFSAAQTGFLFNMLLPFRLGEAVRVVVLSRLARQPVTQSAALTAMDRLADMVGLAVVTLTALVALPGRGEVTLPPELLGNTEPVTISSAMLWTGAGAACLVLVACAALLTLMYLNQDRAAWLIDVSLGSVSKRLAQWTHNAFSGFASGLHAFRSPRALLTATGLSLAAWGVSAASFACVLNAFGISYPWYGPAVMLAMVVCIISAPVTPGLIGQFHLGAVAGLVIGVPETSLPEAKAVSLVAHVVSLTPVLVLGIAALAMSGLGAAELARQSVQGRPKHNAVTETSRDR